MLWQVGEWFCALQNPEEGKFPLRTAMPSPVMRLWPSSSRICHWSYWPLILGSWQGWIWFCPRLLILLGGHLTSPVYVWTGHPMQHMCCIGCLYPSGYYTALVSCCILGYAPSYFCDLCRPASDAVTRWMLHSGRNCELMVPQVHLAIIQCRGFLVLGPSIWKDLPLEQRLFSTSLSSFSSLVVAGLSALLSSFL